MKKIILIILFCVFKIASAQTVPNTNTEYNFKKGDTLVVIKLLKNNRVLFEEHPKQEIKQRGNFSNITPDGKRICGFQTLIYYQSYGTYELTDSEIILNFKDENPIEDINIIYLDKIADTDSINVTIKKDFDTIYDLSISQNDKEVSYIISFEENCEFILTDKTNPLILNYDNNFKTIDVPKDQNIKIIVSINDFKGDNHIKNKRLVFNQNVLNKNN